MPFDIPQNFQLILIEMFPSYKRSLIEMCQSVRTLAHKTLSEKDTNDLCFQIQMRLLKKIIYIEKRISQNRNVLNDLNLHLKSKNVIPLTKAEAHEMKDRISTQKILINEYQKLFFTFKTIGDALAFTYLDKWDIKPQAFKMSPGFMSSKSGLKHELRILRLAFSIGGVALLNDLTNCLRYGDISVISNYKSLIIEVKSSHKRNARILKQISDMESLRDYLNFGKSDKEHGYKGEEVERMLIHSPETNHIEALNTIINKAITGPTGFCLEQIEHGLYYGVSYLETEKFFDAITKITGINNSNKYIVCNVNELKYTGVGYYPFSLSIYDPNAWYSFYAGQLVIVILASSEVMENRIQSNGHSLKFDLRNNFALEIIDVNENNTGKHLVSNHFLGRLFYEFINLNWLLEEIIYQMSLSHSKPAT